MRIEKIRIKNFRGIREIEFSTKQLVTAIVGPNAAGKTTILEAVRLAKCVLMPTYSGESAEALQLLGAYSPALQEIRFGSLLGNANELGEVALTIALSDSELTQIEEGIERLAMLHARNMLGAQAVSELVLVQYLSSEAGRKILQKNQEDFRAYLDPIRTKKQVTPTLIIDPKKRSLSGKDLLEQEILTFLVSETPPFEAMISYFPADRAMPAGEINLQLGEVDAQQQVRSHLGQPSLKYQRLKNYLVAQQLRGKTESDDLRRDFDEIFSGLLTGRELGTLSLSRHGSVTATIKEKETGAEFDIDSMSSGEKGLLLTFLLMRRTVHSGGIVLLDEPELHLNPAVCKKILPFLIERVLAPANIQAILCTHSPELLGSAIDDTRCQLVHLRSSTDASPIYPQDRKEIFEALRRLGADSSEVLFSKGFLFVEGEHDIGVLDAGWPARVTGYKLTQLQGRSEVEKEIRTMQVAETRGELDARQSFVFDLDRLPTNLTNSRLVKLAQWDRYCLENYLLDEDALFEIQDDIKAKAPLSRGEMLNRLRQLALSQRPIEVLKSVYAKLEPENTGLRRTEAERFSTFDEAGQFLADRLDRLKSNLAQFDKRAWTKELVDRCNEVDEETKPVWTEKWRSLCNGKKVLNSVHAELRTSVSQLDFKRKLARRMHDKRSEGWRLVDSILQTVTDSTT